MQSQRIKLEKNLNQQLRLGYGKTQKMQRQKFQGQEGWFSSSEQKLGSQILKTVISEDLMQPFSKIISISFLTFKLPLHFSPRIQYTLEYC